MLRAVSYWRTSAGFGANTFSVSLIARRSRASICLSLGLRDAKSVRNGTVKRGLGSGGISNGPSGD